MQERSSAIREIKAVRLRGSLVPRAPLRCFLEHAPVL